MSMTESEAWAYLYPLRTALRRAIMAAESIRLKHYYVARRLLGATQTAITWAKEKGVIVDETARYLQRLVGALIDKFDRGEIPDPRKVDYLADRIMLRICRVYCSVCRRALR